MVYPKLDLDWDSVCHDKHRFLQRDDNWRVQQDDEKSGEQCREDPGQFERAKFQTTLALAIDPGCSLHNRLSPDETLHWDKRTRRLCTSSAFCRRPTMCSSIIPVDAPVSSRGDIQQHNTRSSHLWPTTWLRMRSNRWQSCAWRNSILWCTTGCTIGTLGSCGLSACHYKWRNLWRWMRTMRSMPWSSHKFCNWLEWNHCNTSVTICVWRSSHGCPRMGLRCQATIGFTKGCPISCWAIQLFNNALDEQLDKKEEAKALNEQEATDSAEKKGTKRKLFEFKIDENGDFTMEEVNKDEWTDQQWNAWEHNLGEEGPTTMPMHYDIMPFILDETMRHATIVTVWGTVFCTDFPQQWFGQCSERFKCTSDLSSEQRSNNSSSNVFPV